MHLETLAIHAGKPERPITGDIVSPLHLSTTYERATDGSYPHSFVYTRLGNPTRQQLEQRLAALEGGAVAAAFASGSAATMSVFQALRPGDHAIAPIDAYSGTGTLLRSLLVPWGLEVSFVDMTDLTQVEQAICPNTALIWVETPSNPLLKIVDISAIARLAHANDAVCVCDNTWATPLLQRPLDLGCDGVVHSTTKYLGGHSDLLGGAVIAKTESDLFQRIRHIQLTAGAVAAPFDCWLLLRGLQTLPYRMRAHCDNALKVAEFLNQHPAIATVHYPGLSHHPQHSLATQQMRAFGGMVSAQIRGGADAAFAVVANLHLFQRATSLGGVESLIEHRASIEGQGTLTPDNLLRLSIGLEHADDLIADLAQSLDGLSASA